MKSYNYYKIDILREMCLQRGLDSVGTKQELTSRLKNFDKKEKKAADLFQEAAVEKGRIDNNSSIKNNNFLLHLNAANLSNYFNFGYIYPLALEDNLVYKNENRAKDVLTMSEEYIIVSKHSINEFEITDILLELVLDDIILTQINDTSLYYIDQPIPISRIKSIYFKTENSKSAFLSSVMSFPDCFIPENLCKVLDYIKQHQVDMSSISLPKNEALNYWKERLNIFDKLLGLFAFTKNSGILFSEKLGLFEDYTSGFLSAISSINSIPELASLNDKTLRSLIYYHDIHVNNAQRLIFKAIIEKVYTNEVFSVKEAIKLLTETNFQSADMLSIRQIIEQLRELDQLAVSYKGLLKSEVVRKNLPVIALIFLSKFSNKSRQNTDKQAVRNSFIKNEFEFSLDVAEYLLGFLGLYYGYKNMVKEDTNLIFEDPVFKDLAESTQSIKFRLDSYLDRFIVESVFRYSERKEQLKTSFEFLQWEEVASAKPLIPKSSGNNDYFDHSYNLLRKRITYVNRRHKNERIFDKIEQLYGDKIQSQSYLSKFVERYLLLDKKYILQLLKENAGKFPIGELDKLVDLDNKTTD